LQYWGLNSGPYACYLGILLEPLPYLQFIIFFFLVVLAFELRAFNLLGRPGTLPLEPFCQPIFVLDIFEIASCELFAGAGLKP
jgi:hypothetical protein